MTRRDALALTALALPRVALAQGDYPDRPVRFVVPHPPGGGTDGIARIVQEKFHQLLGQSAADTRARAERERDPRRLLGPSGKVQRLKLLELDAPA